MVGGKSSHAGKVARELSARPGIYPRWPETRPWFISRQRVHAIRIGTLTVADRDHDCPPPLQTLSGRGSLRSALIAASWCRSSAMVPPHEGGLKLACLVPASRADEVS